MTTKIVNREHRQLSGAVPVILCLLAGGCIPLVAERQVVLDWDAVRAERRLTQTPPEHFTSLRVHLDRFGGVLTLRMPGGAILRTSGITPEMIWPYTPFGKMGNKFPPGSVEGSRQFAVLFDCTFWSSGGGFGFEFKDGHLVAISAGGDSATRPESCRPGIGDAEGKVLFSMPLTQEQLTLLFGPYFKREELRGGGLIGN